MRLIVMTLLTALAAVPAQARQATPAASTMTPPAALKPLSSTDVVPDDRVAPLAGTTADTRILSKNEIYNRARAAEGRLGVRLGNDLSYRITGN